MAEDEQNFNNLDNYYLESVTPCYKKKAFIITFILTLAILIAAGVLALYFFVLAKCEIGDEEKCLTCNKRKCGSCNIGYKLSNGKCVLDYSIKAEYFSNAMGQTKLIFERFIYQVTEIIVDGEKKEPSVYYYFNTSGIHKVYFKMDISNITSLAYLFAGITNMTQIYISPLFNTQNITSMERLLSGCSKLSSMDLSHLNTENVLNMNSMFSGMHSMKSFDIKKFNLKNLQDMSQMFMYCLNLTFVNLSNLHLDNVRDMHLLFSYSSSLTSVDFTNFKVPNLTIFDRAFEKCSSLRTVDLSSFKTPNLEDMAFTFQDCISLISIDLSNFIASKKVNLFGMFSNCNSLSYVNLRNFEAEVKERNQIFNDCPNITYIDISSFWSNDTRVELFNSLPSKGEIIINSNFKSKIEDQIPEGWTINEN